MKTIILCLAVSVYYAHSFPGRKESLSFNSGASALGNGLRLKRQNAEAKRIICYYSSWSFSRSGESKFTPEDFDPQLCTHIIYNFARPELKEGIVPFDTKPDAEEKLWERTVALKKLNPELKVLLGVGGIREGSSRFTKLAADPKERQLFVSSAGNTIREFGFDGIDMNWLFPGFSEGSSPSDKENYVILLKELREELGKDLLTITIPSLDKILDVGFDLPEIQKYVDQIHIWAGNYHSSTDPFVNHPAPLYNVPFDETTKDDNVDATIRSLLARGVPPGLINLVIPNFGLYFILDDASMTDIGSPTDEEADNPEWAGALNFNDICRKIRDENWTVKRINTTALGPYAYREKEWLAWDDELSVRAKAQYLLGKNLGGIGFWSVDMDDFSGACGLEKYPLLKAARAALGYPTSASVSLKRGETSVHKDSIVFPKA